MPGEVCGDQVRERDDAYPGLRLGWPKAVAACLQFGELPFDLDGVAGQNEFCVLQPEFPELLAQRAPWDD